MSIGKRLKKAREGVDREKLYPLAEAVKMVKERAKAKFDETVEIAMNLGVDPRHADQMVRGVVALPNGTGRTQRVAVFARGAKADEARGRDFSSLRMSLSAAEVLSSEIFNGWRKLTSLEIVEGLGSTEALHIYLSNRQEKKKLGAAGLRVPGYEIALKDRDGREVADNEEGILWVRGDSNTPLYWNRPDKSAETIRDDGWIYTGDRFVRDSEGFYFFRGRADDLVKISGQWVYPLEVELCLAEHPEVRECAVFAAELPDQRMTLKAVVVMNDSAFDEGEATERLQDFVKEKLLPFKYPREIKFIEELPKTGTGKIDRQAVMRM